MKACFDVFEAVFNKAFFMFFNWWVVQNHRAIFLDGTAGLQTNMLSSESQEPSSMGLKQGR